MRHVRASNVFVRYFSQNVLAKFQNIFIKNVFLQIRKCISLNQKLYLSKTRSAVRRKCCAMSKHQIAQQQQQRHICTATGAYSDITCHMCDISDNCHIFDITCHTCDICHICHISDICGNVWSCSPIAPTVYKYTKKQLRC